MAVTGFEVDLLRRLPNGSLESVAAFDSYNHHYSGWMYGKHAAPADQRTEHGSDDNPQPAEDLLPAAATMHGLPLPRWTLAAAAPDYPNVQGFSEGNGNEHRGSFHGTPASSRKSTPSVPASKRSESPGLLKSAHWPSLTSAASSPKRPEPR